MLLRGAWRGLDGEAAWEKCVMVIERLTRSRYSADEGKAVKEDAKISQEVCTSGLPDSVSSLWKRDVDLQA